MHLNTIKKLDSVDKTTLLSKRKRAGKVEVLVAFPQESEHKMFYGNLILSYNPHWLEIKMKIPLKFWKEIFCGRGKIGADIFIENQK